MNIAAFTGTNGKTTCSQLYAQLLASVSMGGDAVKSAYIGTTGYAVVEPKSNDNVNKAFAEKRSGHQLTTPDAVSAQRILAELAIAAHSILP